MFTKVPRAKGLDRVVATDDRRVEETVEAGREVVTSKDHAGGTTACGRKEISISKAYKAICHYHRKRSFVVRPMRRERSIPMWTVGTPIFDEEEWCNPNIVKVLTDRKGFALYFSRSPIPYVRSGAVDLNGKKLAPRSKRRLWGNRHIGLYVYRRDFLLKFARLRPTALEQIESLEQLRALVYGHRIFVAAVDERSVEVDTPEDLESRKLLETVQKLKARHGWSKNEIYLRDWWSGFFVR
jgi:3-deoxy-manno-octulosonate cytidylyltransferase (CMP-KDO synthetase)